MVEVIPAVCKAEIRIKVVTGGSNRFLIAINTISIRKYLSSGNIESEV